MLKSGTSTYSFSKETPCNEAYISSVWLFYDHISRKLDFMNVQADLFSFFLKNPRISYP